MTAEEKLAQINARNFTYVSVTYFDADQKLRFDRFVVLTGSKPVAEQASVQIAAMRLPKKAMLATELCRERPIHVYPKNYIREARSMLRSHPQNVYEVEAQTSVKVRN